MYSALNKIFGDKSDGKLFTCFGGWHILYITLFLLAFFIVLFCLKNKDSSVKSSVTKTFSDIAFWIMIADFFFMPFAYGEIDIEKLPFHICTAMCVMCFASHRVGILKKFKIPFAVLGLISNLGYLIYPAGVMWHQTHPFSYRVIETLSFHGIMTVYGLLVLVYEADKTSLKKCYHDLVVIVCMVGWALLGNYAYNGNYGEITHFFNWFFVVRDPFNLLPETISPVVMPFLNVIMFFVADLLVYSIVWLAKRKHKRNET